MPLTIDWPNSSPSPLSACAAALSVRFSLTGSTCSSIDDRLEQRVELRRHRRRVDHVFRRDALRRGIFRRCERHVLVAEHRGGLDIGVDVGRDQVEVLRIDVQGELGRAAYRRARSPATVADPADLHAVVGDLRARVHHQTRARRQHRQLGLAIREVAAELPVDQHDDGDGDQQPGSTRPTCMAVRRLRVQRVRSCRYTVRLKFGLTP